MTKKKLHELADMLEMFSSQIAEHVIDLNNWLPHPSRIEDWLAEYRDVYEYQSQSKNEHTSATYLINHGDWQWEPYIVCEYCGEKSDEPGHILHSEPCKKR